MPQVHISKKGRRKVQPMVIIMAVFVVLLVLTVWYLFFGPFVARTVGQADALDAAGKYGAAESKLDSMSSFSLRKSDKELVLSRLAATNDDMGNEQLALQYYESLNSLDPNNLATLTQMAQDADQIGDNSVAIGSYKQVIALLKSDKSALGGQDEINQMTERVAELQQ